MSGCLSKKCVMFETHANEGNLEGLALLYGADTVVVEREGKDVARRQKDGRWKIVVDNPLGHRSPRHWKG